METSTEIDYFMFTKNLLFMSEKRSELIQLICCDVDRVFEHSPLESKLVKPRSDVFRKVMLTAFTCTISLQVGVVRPPEYLKNSLSTASVGMREATERLGMVTLVPASTTLSSWDTSLARPGWAVSPS